jgi:hypothetical protein
MLEAKSQLGSVEDDTQPLFIHHANSKSPTTKEIKICCAISIADMNSTSAIKTSPQPFNDIVAYDAALRVRSVFAGLRCTLPREIAMTLNNAPMKIHQQMRRNPLPPYGAAV